METISNDISDIFNVKSFAQTRFSVNLRRVELLIDTGIIGINHNLTKINNLIKKINGEEIHPTYEIHEPTLEIELSEQDINLLNKSMVNYKKIHSELDGYLYSTLTVFVWGSFETYYSMLFSQLFTKKPEMLRSSEKITYEELLKNIANPTGLLIEKELNKIGHFKIKEMLEYLSDKLNISFDKSDQIKLHEIYNIRNIIAHNTGIVRNDMLNLIPENIQIINNELQISKDYLEEMINHLKKIVNIIESQVSKKFDFS